MIVEIYFKDPDALQDCIDAALEDLEIEGLSDDELEAVKEERRSKILEVCEKWFEYGEYLGVEVDTDKETCTVMPVK